MLNIFEQRSKIYFSILVLSLVNLYIRASDIFNIDTIWLLTAVERWLAGGDYLKDFYEINPPAAILIHVPAYLIAKVLPFSPMICMYALYSLVAALVLKKVVTLSRDFNWISSETEENILLFVLFLFFVLFPGSNVIAQRDVIVTLLSFPYLLKRLYKNDINIFYVIALVSLWIKPYYSLAIFLCWGIAYFKNKVKFSLKEVILYVVSFSAYALIINSFFKEWWHILWLGLKTYSQFNASLIELLFSVFFNIFFIFTIIFLNKNYKNYPKKIIFPYVTVGAIFLIASVAQFKSYSYYHFGSLAIILSVFIFNGFKKIDNKLALFSVSFTLASAMLIYQFRDQNTRTVEYFKENKELEGIVNQKTTTDDSVFIYSVSISPLLRDRPKVGCRYPYLWPLPAILKIKDNEQRQKIILEIKKNLLEDIKKNKPKIILIPTILYSKYTLNEFLESNKKYCEERKCSEIYNLVKDFKRASDLVEFQKLYDRDYMPYGQAGWATVFIRK